MLKIRLNAEKQYFIINEYDISYPFSTHIYNKTLKKIFWEVSSIDVKNIQGSFRLYVSREIDFSQVKNKSGEFQTRDGILKRCGTYDNRYPPNFGARQCILFEKQLFLYVDEKDNQSYLNGKKTILLPFLLANLTDAQYSICFQLEYERDNNLKISNEEITLYLKLKYDDE